MTAESTTRLGSKSVRGLVDGLEGRVASEISDTPTVRAQREPERHQTQLVPLTGKAGQECHRAKASTPATGQAEQSPTQDAGREVLLGDRCFAALPALSEFLEIREDHVGQHALDCRFGEELVERRLRPRLVEGVEGGGELVARRRWQARRWLDLLVCGASG